jgi:predicted component of type VI protein secretion system
MSNMDTTPASTAEAALRTALDALEGVYRQVLLEDAMPTARLIDAIKEVRTALATAPQAGPAAAPVPAELPKFVTQCWGCEGFPSGCNNPCDVCGRRALPTPPSSASTGEPKC